MVDKCEFTSSTPEMTIHVVGGVYQEHCTHPKWNHTYGSAGRAAIAIGSMGDSVVLHSYMGSDAKDEISQMAAWLGDVQIQATPISGSVGFSYLHDMAVPTISGVPKPLYQNLNIRETKVVRFGMLEGDAVVDAEWAVYDPQNAGAVVSFGANGSQAKHLALVLNAWEARQLAEMPDQSPEACAPVIAQKEGAEVVVIKMGPRGALVWFEGAASMVPAFRTKNVWKIGSGDCFVAHFANEWMGKGKSAADSARAASLATAFYCEHQQLPTVEDLRGFNPPEVEISVAYASGEQREVYLAGPFFDLSQIWLIEQARDGLREVGLKVFSPYHDIGLGSADDVVEKDLQAIKKAHLVFAVVDGLDAGTVYEVGYGRALGKPVVVYSEREKGGESLKMMEGSGCVMCTNFATSIYSVLWEAVKI